MLAFSLVTLPLSLLATNRQWGTKKICAFTVTRHCCSCALAIGMGYSLTSLDSVLVLRYPVLFNGTNYRDWVPHMRMHVRVLQLWDFLTGVLPCSPRPSTHVEPVISEKTVTADKEKLLTDYEDHLASYESLFHAYKTWLGEDARAGSVLTASMEDHSAVDIMEFELTHQI
jgi:hypothetical protein